MPILFDYEPQYINCIKCKALIEKHIIKDGAHYHVLHWNTLGRHCSEPNCEVNHKCKESI
jgi:hypothetical protein